MEDVWSVKYPGAPETLFLRGDKLLVTEKETEFGFFGMLLRTQTRVFTETRVARMTGTFKFLKRIATLKGAKNI